MSTGLPTAQTIAFPELPVTDELHLDPAKTALLIVDMQRDFVDPEGSLHVPASPETLPAIKALLKRARAAGVPVAYTRDTHTPDDREFQIWPPHCIRGTWGWHIVDELAPHDGDLIFDKCRYDAFYDTALEHYLSRVWHTEHLIIAGTVANICVGQTAASAGLRWFQVITPADCISALTHFDQAAALRQVATLYNGAVVAEGTHLRF